MTMTGKPTSGAQNETEAELLRKQERAQEAQQRGHHEDREREREREHEQRERERAREHDDRKEERREGHVPEPKASSSEAVGHQKALSSADLGHIADAARLTWADKLPHALTDRLGRGWNFSLISEPFAGLRVQCGDLVLGLTYMALSVEHPDPVRALVADLAKAVEPAAPVAVPQA